MLFRLERKIVHVGKEKIITLYLLQVKFELENLSATFIDAKITQLQKNDDIFICILIIAPYVSVNVAQR